MRSASVFTDHKEELERSEFQLGLEAGRLAVTLDLLTDALVMVMQHGVYCQSARQPGRPAMDMQAGWLGMRTPEITDIDVDAHDGDTLQCGATEMQFIHTPGHTQGSLCVLIPAENKLIAGDTLFRDSIGRTDLPGGDGRAILRSIHTKLLTLDETTEVIAGHGPETTIGREKALNPFLA